MKLPRRQLLHLAAGAAALPAVARTASAQSYPTRPIRIVVGFAAGQAIDIVTRIVGQSLSERLGQQFIIENRPGAGGNIGTEVVVRAPPDGYTLLAIGSNNMINATLYEKLNYDFIQDIAPVASIYRVPQVVEVNPSFPATTLPEFIEYAKANPGKINFASAGSGSVAHLSGELFKVMAGVNMLHVPYRGAPAALTDLIGGQVQVMFDNMPSSMEHIRAGQVASVGGNCRDALGRASRHPDLDGRVPGRPEPRRELWSKRSLRAPKRPALPHRSSGVLRHRPSNGSHDPDRVCPSGRSGRRRFRH
jgi:tripartite-type tricarboxylate transporter receptor subunit TctC